MHLQICRPELPTCLLTNYLKNVISDEELETHQTPESRQPDPSHIQLILTPTEHDVKLFENQKIDDLTNLAKTAGQQLELMIEYG